MKQKERNEQQSSISNDALFTRKGFRLRRGKDKQYGNNTIPKAKIEKKTKVVGLNVINVNDTVILQNIVSKTRNSTSQILQSTVKQRQAKDQFLHIILENESYIVVQLSRKMSNFEISPPFE